MWGRLSCLALQESLCVLHCFPVEHESMGAVVRDNRRPGCGDFKIKLHTWSHMSVLRGRSREVVIRQKMERSQ